MSRRKGKSPTAQSWTPMRPATAQPLTEEEEADLRAAGATDALMQEMRDSEVWLNHRYTVHVTRFPDGNVAELSIKRNDRKPAHDWREFQRIKNEIAGPEIEAFELYPAMSRLMDTANQYYLWCLPPGLTLPVGYQDRNVKDADEAVGKSKQRALPDDWKEEPCQDQQ